MSDSIVIVSAARTPIGGLLGDFSRARRRTSSAPSAIKAAVERAGVPGDAVDEVLMGNCLMAGQGQAPARQAVLGAGLPQSRRRRDAVQDVRLGHARDDVRARHAAGRQRRRDGGRRHGEHDQRAAPDVRAQGRALRRRRSVRPHGDRRPGRRLRRAAARWACSPRSASPSTASRARRRTQFAIASTQRSKAANEDGSFAWEIAPVTRARARPATR